MKMMYVPGDLVVVRAWGKNEIGLITNVRKKKNQILGYDLRTEKGSAYCVVTVDKPEDKSSISINSTLTAVWHMAVDNDDSEPTNLYLDKRDGHTTANFGLQVRYDDRHWEKCADFSFPVQGARSF